MFCRTERTLGGDRKLDKASGREAQSWQPTTRRSAHIRLAHAFRNPVNTAAPLAKRWKRERTSIAVADTPSAGARPTRDTAPNKKSERACVLATDACKNAGFDQLSRSSVD